MVGIDATYEPKERGGNGGESQEKGKMKVLKLVRGGRQSVGGVVTY